jgi:hypothetical protein
MKLVSVWTALMLLQPAIATASQPAASTPQVTGSKEERAAAAAAYYAQGDFVRAALGFEGLHNDYPQESNFLFNAAASRYGAGHYAHAVAYTQEFLAFGALPAADRQEAEAQLNEAKGNVVAVRVMVTAEPGGQGPWNLVARHVARESGDIRPDLPVAINPDGAPVQLALDPGIWTIGAQGAGYVHVEERVVVSKGGAPVISLRLLRAPEVDVGPPGTVVPPRSIDVPPEVVRRSALGFEIGGGLAAVAGLSLLGAGVAKVRSVETCDGVDAGGCVTDFRDGLLRRDLGVATFGSGVGLLVGGLTWKLQDARARRKAWIAEAAFGGVAVVVGMILIPTTFKSFNVANNVRTIDAWQDHYQEFRQSAGHALSSAVFGLGLGTLVSASTSLVLQRKHMSNQLHVGGMAGRGQFGLTLSGRF